MISNEINGEKVKENENENDISLISSDQSINTDDTNQEKNSLLDKVECKIHGKEKIAFLLQNGKPTTVICLICKSNNQLKIEENEVSNMNVDEVENNINRNYNNVYCYKHFSAESNFYCIECSEFICRDCITSIHREHNSSILEVCKEDIIKRINKFNFCLKELKIQLIDAKSQFITQIDKFNKIKSNNDEKITTLYKTVLNDLNSYNKSFLVKINSNPIIGEIETIKSYEKNLMNLNMDHDSNTISILGVLDEIEDDTFTSTDENNIKFINEISKKVDKIKAIRNEIQSNFINGKNRLLNIIKNQLKYSGMFYETVKLSLFTSRFFSPLYIKRFINYYDPGLQYIKKTSLYLNNNSISSKRINLIGLSLCGIKKNFKKKSNLMIKCLLTISAVKIIINTNSHLSTTKIDEKTKNNLLDNDNNLYQNLHNINAENSLESVPIQLLSEVIYIKEVEENCNIPVFNYFFYNYEFIGKKCYVELRKDYRYLIQIENLDENRYINTWYGRTLKRDFKSMFKNINQFKSLEQEIVPNNQSDVSLKITSSEESDLNEFSAGIISDFIIEICN